MSSYITASAVQSELQSTVEFGANTVPSLTTVTEWIEEESSALDDDLGMSYESTSNTVLLDYKGEDILTMKNSPIISVDKFEYCPVSVSTRTTSDWEEKTEDTDFTVYNDRGEIVILTKRFNPKIGMKRFRIVYTSGYSSTPAKISRYIKKAVALRVLNTLISRNVNERNDGGSVSVGSISIVEPDSYGVNSYKQLKEDVSELYKDLVKSSGVHRYNMY